MQKSGYFIDFSRYMIDKKYCNLTGRELFGHYLTKKNFSKYGIYAGTQQII